MGRAPRRPSLTSWDIMTFLGFSWSRSHGENGPLRPVPKEPQGEHACTQESKQASHHLTWTLVCCPRALFVQKAPKFSIHPLKSHSLLCGKVHLIFPGEGEKDGVGWGESGVMEVVCLPEFLPSSPSCPWTQTRVSYSHSAEWTGIITLMRTEETQSWKLSSAFCVLRAVLNVWDTSISLTPCSDFLSWT